VKQTPRRPAQSKGFRARFAQSAATADFAQHMYQNRARSRARVTELQLFIHHGKALPISAMVGLRYLYNLMRRWDRIERVLPEFASMGMHRAEW